MDAQRQSFEENKMMSNQSINQTKHIYVTSPHPMYRESTTIASRANPQLNIKCRTASTTIATNTIVFNISRFLPIVSSGFLVKLRLCNLKKSVKAEENSVDPSKHTHTVSNFSNPSSFT